MKNFFKKHKSESIEKRMGEIKTFMFVTAKAIAENPDTDMADYITKVRVPLNTMIIETCMGLTLKVKEGKHGMKSHFQFGPKPDLSTISELAEILDYFIETVEKPFYNSVDLSAVDFNEDDDMDIPDDIDCDCEDDEDCAVSEISYIREILIPEKDNNILKLSRKKLLKLYKNRLSKGTIRACHLIQLYNAGRTLRKRKNTKITIISVTTVAALVGAAIFVGYKCSKGNDPTDVEDTDIEDIDDIDTEDIGDIDIGEIGEEEVPMVDISDGDIV